ncbi:MAG: aldolase/citrate lyase family protein [Yoonia sp.]|uniref:HpcH/HpaI aldolase family protein n=1 Tax=Yoonia sp. TaxID=2212373 RepID=UPI00273E1D5F|nr:aldolase/citrate lyase family protein [Yoonia sp.]MDP5086882.1 aldolase/citrate lyase family protein [Yoonia sp.]MDP5361681.1 aldolase/citrate lyase family protein [Paracoccaceae bacterium]
MSNFKHRLHSTQDRLTGHICTIPSATVTQAMAAAGADAVIIDMEHGAVDYASAHAMIAATKGTGCAPLVRVAENDPSHVKRVLDLGAEGIVFPLIRTADDARKAVASLFYPPKGNRGFGPFIAHSMAGVPLAEYKDAVDGTLSCVLLIETVDAVENIEEIVKVPGIDLLVPAQFDLSTDLGVSGQFDHPDFIAAIAKVEKASLAAGIPLGGVALAEAQAASLFARGYRLIAGFDLLWLKAKTAETQAWTKL